MRGKRKENGHKILIRHHIWEYDKATKKLERHTESFYLDVSDPHGAPESIGCFDQTITHRSPVFFDSFDTFEDRLINMSDAEYERYLQLKERR